MSINSGMGAGFFCTVAYVQVKGEAQETYEDYVVQAIPNPETIVVAEPYKGAVLLQVSNSKAFSEAVDEKSGFVFYIVPNVVGLSKQETIKIMEDRGILHEISDVSSTTDATVDDVVATTATAGELVQIEPEAMEAFPRKVKLSIVNKSKTASALTTPEEIAPEVKNKETKACFPVSNYSYVAVRFENGHRGTDIVADAGTNIVAELSGTVVKAEFHESYGWCVSIDSGVGVKLLYAHCKASFVEEGTMVEAGDVIATVGHSGMATGAQLHLEYSVDETLQSLSELFQRLNSQHQ